MNTLKRILFVLAAIFSVVSNAFAEQVNVTITPKQPVLPPQVLLYISNPGLYFNISVQNPESEAQSIFFGAEIHQIMPSGNMDIVVPALTYPMQGITIPANQSRLLDAVEMRNMFNHVRQSDIQMPQDLFANVADGTFGLLSEGTYELTLNAYKWDPHLSSPILLSNPTLSKCTFTVCYQANAPAWVTPVSMNDYEDHNIATLSKQVPMLQWSSPVVNCNPSPIQYVYDLKIVQAMPLQHPEEAMERNAVVYQKTGLTMPQCLIPPTVIKNFSPTETYVAQISARSNNTQIGSLDFILLQNEGKSELLQFRVKDYSEIPTIPDVDPEPEDTTTIDIFALGGKDKPTDSLYVFRNPELTTPSFTISGGARKLFTGYDITVDWRKSECVGGHGNRPDSIKFAYAVQLFAANEYLERDEMLEREPVYTSKSLDVEYDTIRWQDIREKVNKGDYCLIRVVPAALNENSVTFIDDSINTIDFALINQFSPQYFQCSNGLEITNTNPTTRTAESLKDSTVTIGEYELVLDGAKLSAVDKKPGHFSGTGHVIWKPFNFTWKLAVKFDEIAINTDNEVFEGLVETFEGDEDEPIDGSEVVNKLFSDWGIDNLIADTGIPYADKLQGLVDGKVASLADELGEEISGYYNEIKKGKNKFVGLLNGNFDDVTFPLRIPDDINPTPVDLQISKMKFAPTYASMDFFGTFVVPETEVTKNQILVFGAPRICISPESLIPEGTTIALLKDFTIKDPSTAYDCTFKAPTDVISPENGCYISWSGSEFEAFRMDIDMTLPNLKKVENGKATSDNPKLHITADVKAPINSNGQKLAGWDWYGMAKLDDFEHEDLPGYTFSVGKNVYIDHSARENANGMPAFPKDYDLSKAQMQGKEVSEWMGVYIDEISMAFPEDIKVGDEGERMKVGLYNMFIDKSGMTVEAGIVNAINYRAGDNASIDGFAFSMDTISVNFVQNQHKDFKFCGKMEIPLMKGTVNYSCNIFNQKFAQKDDTKLNGYAYVFKTWQLEGLSFDFWLADLTLDKRLTYFLLEALPDDAGELKTNFELMIGGEVELACADKVNNLTKKLPLDLTLPGIKFCGMRLSNTRTGEFESRYEHEMQKTAQDVIKEWTGNNSDINWWNEAKDIAFCDNSLFLNLGQWGYASPQKKIGPFEFTLTKYDLDLDGDDLSFTLGGDITLNKDLKITAGTTISFHATVKNLSLKKISDVSFEYKETKFESLTLDIEVTGFKLNGTLNVKDDINSEGYGDKGYSGSLDIEIADALFKISAKGGYYDHHEGDERWSWGYFQAQTGSDGKDKKGATMGIPMGPISLTYLKGGFYFNCAYNGTEKDETKLPIAKKGAIGVIFGLGLASTDGSFTGNFDFAVCVLKNKDGDCSLSSFKFTGEMTCLGGAVKTDVDIIYESNETDRYFQLNVTVDAKADGLAKNMQEKIESAASALQELTGKAEAAIQQSKDQLSSTFGAAFNDNSESSSGKDADQARKDLTKDDKEGNDDGPKATAGASVSLDLRIQSRRNGEDLPNIAWHVYLGEPDEDKRCKFVLVDFQSDLVTVSVGANAYLCIGSELPGNGALPDLPEKVSKFLANSDNEDSDSGVGSDSKAYAEKKRKATMERFKQALGKNGGGVMLGAQVWGYIDVDLHLFYGEMGATAGFDVSIGKYEGAVCVNTGSTPGYNNWYGQGQLYAYLYCKFGFRIDLGFFSKKIDLVDAGVGGVLEARLPNPNYFTGKARCKLNLLGGLVKINKTFSFECGETCNMFVGNALDNYELFESCSLGSDNIEEIEEHKISWQLDARPTVTTQSALDKQVSVLDPTEEERMKNASQNTDVADFTAWASRKFRFSIPNTTEPVLTEYETLEDCKNDNNGTSTVLNYTTNDLDVVMDLTKLNPNKFYKLTVTGVAKEYIDQRWQDPEKWEEDGNKGKYVSTPWSQTKSYYFCTDDKRISLNGIDDFSKVVKLAFPMANDNESVIIKSNTPVVAHLCDIKRPIISLSQTCRDELLKNNNEQNGRLYWAIYGGIVPFRADGAAQTNYPTDYFYTRPNKWIENDSVAILTPDSDFPVSDNFTEGTIKLLYEWDEEVNDLGEWKVVEEYTMISNSKEYAQNAAEDYAKRKYGNQLSRQIGTQIGKSAKGYRLSVDRDEYLNAEMSESNGITYRIKIYKFVQGVKLVTYTKELYSIPVEAKTILEKSFDDETGELYFKMSDYYWSNYTATRLNRITIDDGISANNQNLDYLGMQAPDYSDDILIGGTSKTSKFPSFKSNKIDYPYLTKDPAAFFSYLSNLFFIGGYRIKDEGGDTGLDVQQSESMRISTPFNTQYYPIGKLPVNSVTHAIKQAYNENVEALFMTPSHYSNAQTEYPLCNRGDGRIGAIISPAGMQRTINGYLDQINSLYDVWYAVSTAIAEELRPKLLWNDKSWKEYNTRHGGTYLTLTAGNESKGTQYGVQIPYYQFVLVGNSPRKKEWINSAVKTHSNDTNKHWRINKSSGTQGHNLRSKMTYAVIDADITSKDGKVGTIESAGFLPIMNSLEYNENEKLVKSINYTRYRVNAWNFKNLNYTVFTGAEAETPNKFFCKNVTMNKPLVKGQAIAETNNFQSDNLSTGSNSYVTDIQILEQEPEIETTESPEEIAENMKNQIYFLIFSGTKDESFSTKLTNKILELAFTTTSDSELKTGLVSLLKLQFTQWNTSKGIDRKTAQTVSSNVTSELAPQIFNVLRPTVDFDSTGATSDSDSSSSSSSSTTTGTTSSTSSEIVTIGESSNSSSSTSTGTTTSTSSEIVTIGESPNSSSSTTTGTTSSTSSEIVTIGESPNSSSSTTTGTTSSTSSEIVTTEDSSTSTDSIKPSSITRPTSLNRVDNSASSDSTTTNTTETPSTSSSTSTGTTIKRIPTSSTSGTSGTSNTTKTITPKRTITR